MDKKGDLIHDIQNELISIMVLQLQRGLATDRMHGYYSITADEYCNISNKEKLTICLRWVYMDNMEADEDIMAFNKMFNKVFNKVNHEMDCESRLL